MKKIFYKHLKPCDFMIITFKACIYAAYRITIALCECVIILCQPPEKPVNMRVIKSHSCFVIICSRG